MSASSQIRRPSYGNNLRRAAGYPRLTGARSEMVGSFVVSTSGRHVRPGLASKFAVMIAIRSRICSGVLMPEQRRQHIAVILRQALIDPEQIVLHGDVEVGSPEARRAPEFAVPGVRIFMSQQVAACTRPPPFQSVKYLASVLSSLDWSMLKPFAADGIA